MITRRAGDDPFFRIFENFTKIRTDFNVHFFAHGGNDIDKIHEPLLDANKFNVIFCLDLTHYKTRQRILKELQDTKAKLWWIGAERNPFKHKDIVNTWWGGEFHIQAKEYFALNDIVKTHSQNDYHWISLTLGPRHCRIFSSTCLMHDADMSKGEMRVKTHMAKDFKTMNDLIMHGCKWQTDLTFDLQSTYEKMLSRPWWGSKRFLWQTYNKLGHCNNALNFDMYLRELYKSTLVEVVNETSVADEETGNEAPIFITEKFVNSVYAMNLPIICSAKGTVRFLEQLGFDMFRSHINHDYDDIEDHAKRIHHAIKDNQKLFNDYNFAKQAWDANYEGMIQNKLLHKRLSKKYE